MNLLVLYAGSNSLKFEVIAVEPNVTTPDLNNSKFPTDMNIHYRSRSVPQERQIQEN
jgi:hypothetical protein